MALINVDLSRARYSRFVRYFLVGAPGGLLVIGLFFVNPEIWLKFISIPGLGYYTRLALVVFVAYIVGFTLSRIRGYLSGMIGGMIGGAFAAWGMKFPEHWKNRQWRLTAKAFLTTLAPDTIAVYSDDAFNRALAQTQAVKDEAERMKRVEIVIDTYRPIQAADFEWYNWYEVIKRYFEKSGVKNRAIEEELMLSISVAALIVLHSAPHFPFRNILLVLAYLSILLYAVASIATAFHYFEAADLTAKLLREIKNPRQKT